jgi:hypothetical protein
MGPSWREGGDMGHLWREETWDIYGGREGTWDTYGGREGTWDTYGGREGTWDTYGGRQGGDMIPSTALTPWAAVTLASPWGRSQRVPWHVPARPIPPTPPD